MNNWTLQEYQKENTAVRPPIPSPELWTPPEPSLGLRHFPFASKASSRCVLIADNRCIEAESRGERNATLKFLADPNTMMVVEQSPRVEWVDKDGEVHEHVFDLHVTRRVGRGEISKVAVDVKPYAKVKSSDIKRLHKTLAKQMDPTVADELLVFTEKKFTRADLYNVELFHGVFKQQYPDDDKVILGLITKMKGPAPIADLVEASHLNGYGFNAVARAIAVGHLALVKPALITHRAVVAPMHQG
jgi:hypothetical protein